MEHRQELWHLSEKKENHHLTESSDEEKCSKGHNEQHHLSVLGSHVDHLLPTSVNFWQLIKKKFIWLKCGKIFQLYKM